MTDARPTAPSTVLAGRYRLDGVLGRGGMAQVYRGFDTVLGRPVAVKLFHADDTADDTALRHHSEVATLARLDHPGLVTLFDGGVDDGRPFVVMQLVEGSTLANWCAARPLASAQVATIGVGLAEALAYVHARGVVHRDVKPANVLIDEAGRTRLADFGIARLVDTARLTQTGFTVGTAAYLAPEQVSGDPVGPPADIYALGLVLLECLTGRREYAGAPVEAAVVRLSREPSIPSSLPAGWPDLLAAMTARAPRDRPAAGEVAARLQALADVPAGPVGSAGSSGEHSAPGTDAAGHADPATRRLPVAPPAARQSRVRPGLLRRPIVLVAALVLAAVVAALVVLGTGGQRASPGPHGGLAPSPATTPGSGRLGNDLQQLRQAVQP